MNTLQFLDLPSKLVRIWGALDFDKRPNGLGVRRLPHWTRSQVPEGLDVMARMPSGVRVQFTTDSPKVSLSVLTTSTRVGQGEQPNVPFQLQIGQELYTKFATQGNTLQYEPTTGKVVNQVRGSGDTLIFDGLSTERKLCEIWLPQNVFVELRDISIEDKAQWFTLESESRKRWVHYGSSISHCFEARLPAEIWPAVAARRANLALTNLGVGGQCHLDPLVARTIRDLTCDFISIKVGINIINMNSMKERVFTPLLHGFIDTIREKQPSTPILLISPIYCPSAENRPGPTIPDGTGKFQTNPSNSRNDGSMTLTRVREILANVVETRRGEGDTHLEYFNGLDLFGESDRDDLPDDLHPNSDGYIRMGNRFYEQFLSQVFA